MADLARLQQARYLTAGLVAEFKRSGFTFSICFCVSGLFFAESKRTIFPGPLTKGFHILTAGNFHNRSILYTYLKAVEYAVQAVGYLKQQG